MKILKKLSLSTVTISNLDTTKIVGGAAPSNTPKCITLTPNPPTMHKVTERKPCSDTPTIWSECC